MQSVYADGCILTNEWPLRVFRLKERAMLLASKFSNLHLNVLVFGRETDIDLTAAKENSLTKDITDLKPAVLVSFASPKPSLQSADTEVNFVYT